MRSKEFIREKSQDYQERRNALTEIEQIIFNPEIKTWSGYTIDMMKRVMELAKVTGRAQRMRNNTTVGSVVDKLKQELLNQQKQAGKLPDFKASDTTARNMARRIALYTNGHYESRNALVWTSGRTGRRSKDASDFVVYSDKQGLNDALAWAESMGKKVHYREGDTLHTAIQLGRYVIQNATSVYGVFSDTPRSVYAISVRSAAALNQGVRRLADITDQQATALQDIANTKNANAMEMIKAMMNVLSGEANLKTIIDNSKKITPRDKAKLDAIISNAGNFKEPE